jgi:DNA-binding NtrC family response regulator
MLDAMPGPRILFDTDYRILAANRAYREEFGGANSVVGQTCYQVSHRFDRSCDQCGESCPRTTAERTGRASRVLHLHYTPQGREYVDVELLPIRGQGDQIRYFIEAILPLRKREGDRPMVGMVGRSSAYQAMLALIHRVAGWPTSVLLLGESGTGKELAAQTLHEFSTRAGGPFVPVDCSGMTESLFESELFGYEKGAFTGANQRKIGLVEAAAGGTLFLDELGDIPLSLQVKLLRLLETGSFRRVGGVESLRADFRLVTATHRDLQQMVEDGTFRRDLYYRIAAFPINLPPLRERRDDLPLLTDDLLKRLAPDRRVRLTASAQDVLAAYEFPGNIRELRNVLERALILADNDLIEVEHLPARLGDAVIPDTRGEELPSLPSIESLYLRQMLERLQGDKGALARQLGISRRTIDRKLKRK